MRNPKDRDAQAEDRAPLDLLEPAADEAISRVMKHGAEKYGIRNYAVKDTEISYRVYIAAIGRHIAMLKRGEDVAPDSGLHHLAHIGANVHVLMAAMEAGTLVDDRGPFRGPEPEPTEGVDTCERLGVCPNCRQRSMKHGKCESCGYTNGDDTTDSEGYETGAPVKSWLDVDDDH